MNDVELGASRMDEPEDPSEILEIMNLNTILALALELPKDDPRRSQVLTFLIKRSEKEITDLFNKKPISDHQTLALKIAKSLHASGEQSA